MTTSTSTVIPLVASALAAALLATGGCDSGQRVEDPTPADEESPRSTSVETDSTDEPSVQPQPLDRATRRPGPDDLERFTRDLGTEGALVARLTTTHGILECRLFERHAPTTVANFVGLARGLKAFVDPGSGDPVSGVRYYDDNEFHRVIPDMLVQTGDPTGRGYGGPGYTLPAESSDQLSHDGPGVLSMARHEDEISGSQFFITERPLPELDGDHPIFGHCQPLEVVKRISHVPTTALGRPVDPVPRIEMIQVERREDPPVPPAPSPK